MAGVEIDADRLADRVAQSEECADIVDALMAVQFETELPDAEALGIGDEPPPIRDQHVFPLIAQYGLRFGRPVRRHPIGVGIAGPTRAARHHDHPFDPQKTGERDRTAPRRTMPTSPRTRMLAIEAAVVFAEPVLHLVQAGPE